MTKNNKRIYFGAIIFSVIFIFAGNRLTSHFTKNIIVQNVDSQLDEQVFAKVIKINGTMPNPNDKTTDILNFTAIISSGKYKGLTVRATQYTYKDNSIMPVGVNEGDKVVLSRLTSGGTSEWAFENYERIDKIFMLLIVFAALLAFFGRKKGVSAVLSLLFTCLALFYVFVPSITAGMNIYASTVIICVYIIAVTFALSGGTDKKSLSAAIGCTGGVVFSGIIFIIMDKAMKLTGYYNTQSSRIVELFSQSPIDLKGVVFAMITIGALGAVMDVAMSIASSLGEIKNTGRKITKYSIFKSGLRIGRDIMGTMTNTLILAYIGSNLAGVLIYAASNYPILQLLNEEEIIIEFLQSLAGSLGMLFTIPFTAAVSAALFTQDSEKLNIHANSMQKSIQNGLKKHSSNKI